jgi:hypothetical protein
VSLNPTTLIANCWPQLHATSAADVVFTDADELLRFLSDAIKSFAQRFGVFVVRHTTRTLGQGTLTYTAPPRHLSTLHVALLETGKPLVASSTKEQEYRSTSYRTTQATAAKPIRWFYEDKEGTNVIGIVPVPGAADAGNHLDIVYHRYPCEIEEGIETIKTWGDYLEICALRDAYTADSDFSIPESAQTYDGISKIYEKVAEALYFKAQ